MSFKKRNTLVSEKTPKSLTTKTYYTIATNIWLNVMKYFYHKHNGIF